MTERRSARERSRSRELRREPEERSGQPVAQPLQPLPAQVAEDMVAAGVPTMLVR